MKTASRRVGGQILLIPPEDIIPNPNQPREVFDKTELEGLAQSIRQNGMIQPIAVRRGSNSLFELISGERRLRAAKSIGLKSVPCIIMEADDERSALFALIENMQRTELGFFEEAAAIERLLTVYGMNRDEICKRLGKSAPAVSNKLRLLRLPPEIRCRISAEGLTERHARALLRLDEEKMETALKLIIAKKLNVAQTEELINKIMQVQGSTKKKPVKLFKDVRIFINTIDHAVKTMKQSGINAEATKTEDDEYIQYTVKIPKTGGSH